MSKLFYSFLLYIYYITFRWIITSIFCNFLVEKLDLTANTLIFCLSSLFLI
jgi:hypothetical protein